jgi:hypothetical protein
MDIRGKIHYIDEACCFASRDDVTLSIWRGKPTPERLKHQRKVLEDSIKRYDRIWSLTAFRPSGADFSSFRADETRPHFDALAKLVDGHLYAHCLVVDGTGFVAAVIRSSATSLGFLFRNRVKTKTFEEPYAAAKWLVSTRETGPKPGESEAVEAVVREMNLRLDAHATA